MENPMDVAELEVFAAIFAALTLILAMCCGWLAEKLAAVEEENRELRGEDDDDEPTIMNRVL